MGWEELSDGTGAITPENYVIYEDDSIAVTICNTAHIKYSSANVASFPGCILMGSSYGTTGSEAVTDSSAIYVDGCAIFKIEAKVLGRLTLTYSAGHSSSTMYAWDMTANSNMCVLSNYTEFSENDEVKTLSPSFVLNKGRIYYVFASDSNVELYGIEFDPYIGDTYTSLSSEDDYRSTCKNPC